MDYNKYGIYCITINNKRYIGQTTLSFKFRKRSHLQKLIAGNHKNIYLQRAYNKYCSFNFRILEVCNSIEECNESEIFYINLYKTLNPKKGYNIKTGGDNGKHSINTKKLISLRTRGQGNGMYGKHHTIEARIKISQSRLNQTKDERALRSNSQLGKKVKNQSGYKGVSWHNSKNRWMARVNLRDNGKRKHVGYYKTQIEAAKNYDKIMFSLYGRIELLNFPNDYYKKVGRL